MSKLLYSTENLSEKAVEKLVAFRDLIIKWNENINIVSSKDVPNIWMRHIIDSLQITPFLGSINKLADMGAGIGFPSIPLAIACPELNIFAIEPNSKKVKMYLQKWV